jgi:hypothetical protein
MITLRTGDLQKKYEAVLAGRTGADPCVLCAGVPLREFVHWKIMRNDFPYDLVANRHDMLVPKRHVIEAEVSPEEWAEYWSIKRTVFEDEYDYLLEGASRTRSIPLHFHIHLITLKAPPPL